MQEPDGVPKPSSASTSMRQSLSPWWFCFWWSI